MDQDVADRYRREGAAIFARCRRLIGDDEAAAAAAAKVFSRSLGRPVTGELVRAVCAEHRKLLLVPPTPMPTAEEVASAKVSFDRDVYERTLPFVLRDQRPPPVLRWVFIYAPIVVCLAAVGMFLAAKNPREPERFGGGKRAAHISVYRGDERLKTGHKVRVGERLRIEVVPSGNRFATVKANARVLEHLGPLPENAGPIALPPFVVDDEGHLRLSGEFGPSAKGLPATEVGILLEIE